jgi:glycosyltransferase involved in cell wall biosynthesis
MARVPRPEIMKVFYFGFFDSPVISGSVGFAESGSGVYLSILDSLNKNKKGFELISVNCARLKTTHFRKVVKCFNGVTFIQRPAFKKTKTIFSKLDYVFFHLWLNHFLRNEIADGDIAIIYHSPAYMKIFTHWARESNHRLIVNVEEFYSDPLDMPKLRKSEEQLFSSGKGFICANNIMGKERCFLGKPACVIYGDYRPAPIISKPHSDYVRLVYAGTLSLKKGIQSAIMALSFLPERYRLDILSAENPTPIIRLAKESGVFERVSFDGEKKGDDFLRFITTFDIGLALQTVDGCYNSTSFPSKIVNYLKCGLSVVSTPSIGVVQCSLSKNIIFSKDDSPQEIAKSVLLASGNLHDDSRQVIDLARSTFIDELGNLLGMVSE